MRVVIAAGGTAGHILPALALGRVLRDRGADVVFAGTPDGQESRVVPEAGFAFVPVDARSLARRSVSGWPMAIATTLRSLGAARAAVRGADVVVGMGGYASVPIGVAAVMARTPLVLHEQNSVPGLANRLLSRRASVVALSFESARRGFPRSAPTRFTGNPVRDTVLEIARRRADDPAAVRAAACSALGLGDDAPVVVVFGGSQGARSLNDAAIEGLARLPEATQMVLIAGPANEASVASTGAGVPRLKVFGYLDRMELAYAVADVIVARAGATTCAEVTACGVPAILVPYPYATDDHQLSNARALEAAGAASVVLDGSMDASVFVDRVGRLLADPGAREAMSRAGRTWSKPDAASALADLVGSVA